MKVINTAVANYKKLLTELHQEKQLLPRGSLVARKNRYSHYLNGRELGITQQPEKIVQLARSKYVEVLIMELSNYLNTPLKDIHKFTFPTHKKVIASLPKAYQKLPDHYFYQTSLDAWLNQPVNTNPRYLEHLTYPTKSGIFVRSKEEVLISNALTDNGIPHKFEVVHKVGGLHFYPDFTIRNPYTGKQFILEHHGAFHIEKYGETAHKKIVAYNDEGLILNDTLIITYSDDIKTPNRLQEIIDTVILRI